MFNFFLFVFSQPFVIAVFLMYLFRPLADNVESCFKTCGSDVPESGTQDEHKPFLTQGDVEGGDEGEEEPAAKPGSIWCSTNCAGHTGRIVGTALSVVFALCFMSCVAVIVAHSLTELEGGGKLDKYRKQYSMLENKTAAYFSETLKIDGDKFVRNMWGNEDALSKIGGMLLNFMSNFASSLLLVLVFLTFMLVDDQLNDGPRERWEKTASLLGDASKIPQVIFDHDSDGVYDATRDEERKRSCCEKIWYIFCCCDDAHNNEHQEEDNEIGIRQAINRSIMQYIVLKTKICALASTLVFLILSSLGIPLAGLIALVSFVMNYIPNFGPAVATVLPVPIVLLDNSLTNTQGVLAILLPALVHGIIGNVLEPILFHANKDIDLHPVVLIGCIVFWYILWGVPGAILAVPLTTTIKIICERMTQNEDEPASRGVWIVKEFLNGRVSFGDK